MKSADIRTGFLEFFRERGHRIVSERAAGSAGRPHPAVHQRRHGAVQGQLPGHPEAGVAAGGLGAEVHARLRQAQRPGERRPQPAPSHLLRDAGQLLLRRLLQGGRHPLRLGAGDPRLGAAGRAALRHRLRGGRRGLRPLGEALHACRPGGSTAAARRTTSGPWARPAPAARAARSSSTSIPSGRRSPGRRARTPGATWRSGTWSSCSSTATARGR